MSDRWDKHFLRRALFIARDMSKDPRTQVGAVVVGPDREPLTDGFNGLPRGIEDTPARLNNKELKLKLVVHAELNAILNAARVGTALKGATLYLAATDDSGLVWGGPPCTRCSTHLIQAGIREVVSYPVKPVPSSWHEDLALARTVLEEAGIIYRELAP